MWPLTRFVSSPVVVGEIDYDGFGGTADYYPSKRFVSRWVDFAVRQAGGNVEEVACANGSIVLSALSPLDIRLAFKSVDDCFLRAVVMDAGARSGPDQERSAPHAGGDTQFGANGRVALGAGRLRCAGTELPGTDNADVFVAHRNRIVDLTESSGPEGPMISGQISSAACRLLLPPQPVTPRRFR